MLGKTTGRTDSSIHKRLLCPKVAQDHSIKSQDFVFVSTLKIVQKYFASRVHSGKTFGETIVAMKHGVRDCEKYHIYMTASS